MAACGSGRAAGLRPGRCEPSEPWDLLAAKASGAWPRVADCGRLQ
jgi:hypothetical protein